MFVAGGVYTGEDIAHYARLGAAGAQLATRFIPTYECDASGAIAVRIGEGLDFDSANALTVRKETVMTSEDLLDEEETQQEIVDMLK